MKDSFWKSLYEFGIWRILTGSDFLGAFFVTLAGLFLSHYHGFSLQYDFELLLNVEGILFAFVFAALAIMISLSDEKFLGLLKELKVFDGILFPYWYSCFLFLATISCLVLIDAFPENHFLLPYLEPVGIFLFWYSIFAAFLLVKTTILIAIHRKNSLK